MRVTLRRAAFRVSIVALLVFLGTAPTAIQYLSSLPIGGLGIGRPVTAHDFSSAPEDHISPAFLLLTYSDVAVMAIQEGNYSTAQGLVTMMRGRLPNSENNMRTYLMLLQQLISTLDSAKSGLDQLRQQITDGEVDAAQQKVPQLQDILTNASRRLDMASKALDRVWDQYWPMDFSGQMAKLQGLSHILTAYETLLGELKDLLKPASLRTATQLDLKVWPNPVRINETLHIQTKLSTATDVLPGRIIYLLINNKTNELLLNQKGEASLEYMIPSDNRTDDLKLYARFTPQDKDASIYNPARSTIQTVPVEYYPSTLTFTSSSSRIHILEDFTMRAKLTDTLGRGLTEESVDLLIEDQPLQRCLTDKVGECTISASLPSGTPEGKHELSARYEPEHGVYAPASSEKTEIEVYYVKSIINPITLNGLTQVGGDSFVVSGQTLWLESRLEVDSKPVTEGLVIALLGNQELARVSLGSDGVFRMVISLPLDATGDQILNLVSVPAEPWIRGTVAVVALKIMNSPIMIVGLGAIVSAAAVLSGRSIDLRSIIKRPRKLEKNQKTETEEGKAEVEATHIPIEFQLGYLKGLEDPRICVRDTYWEIRRVLATVLKDAGNQSETHREYEARISSRLSVAKAFSSLTSLFELAEYSQHPLSRLEADEAINQAVLIAEATNAEVRR